MITKNKLNAISVAFMMTIIFVACSDWTDTESVKIKESDIEKDDPELYAKYLANLRNYRNSDHKVAYVWFNNKKDMPKSRGEQISAIPDSVDVVNLMNPDELSSWVTDDMESVRKNKAMRFVYTISHPDLEKEYEQHLSEKEGEEGEAIESEEETGDSFLAYTDDFVERKLALAGKYGYDGISVLFYGKNTNHLTQKEKEAWLAREAAFMSKITDWVNNNSNKLFIFEGYPQNLTDKSVLQKAEFIVIRTESLKYASGLTFQVLQTIEEGVPADRFVVTVSAKDFTDDKIGYYFDANNELVPAIPVAAEWVDTYEQAFSKAGLGILNAQNDYYSGSNSYMNIRNAINKMNP